MPEELKYKPDICDRLEGIAKFLACVLALLTAFYAGMLYVNF